VSDSIADRLRSLLASDVYTSKGRLRADDLLIRQRISHGLSAASGRVKDLISQWRADRVPPSTREQPFPPAEVMEPMRRAERLARDIDGLVTDIGGLSLISEDRVWNRVRSVGLDELLQFDWTLVGEADDLASTAAGWPALDAIDMAAAAQTLTRIRQVIADRRHYLEFLG
jgi:hypothetical protein